MTEKTQQEISKQEVKERREKRETKVLVYGAGVILALASLLGFYLAFSEGVLSDDFFFFLLGALALGTLSFLCFSPWRKVNFLIGGILVSSVGIWMLIGLFDYQYEDFWTAVIWTILVGLWGASLLARAFNRTLTIIVKNFFQLKAVRTTGNMVKHITKLIFWAGLVGLVIWLIVALGPLWIIAIILLLILFVLSNK
jgi:hypothetical protein